MIAPGSADSRETAVDIGIFHCVHGHVNEFLLRETKSLRANLQGELRPSIGCSMSKGYRKPIANSTKSRATQKLKIFVLISVGLRAPIRCKVSGM